MNSFESYYFQKLDRDFTEKEGEALNRFSSRMGVRERQGYVHYDYSYGGKAWKDTLVKSEAEVMFYLYQWFGGALVFRFDSQAVWRSGIRDYEIKNIIRVWSENESVYVEVSLLTEGPGEWWGEVAEWGNPFGSFYEETLAGDFRWLYLCWVIAQSVDVECLDPDAKPVCENPAVPQGMGELTEAHWKLADFFQADRDVIRAAVELAPSYEDEGGFQTWDDWEDGLGKSDFREITRALQYSPWTAYGVLYRKLREMHREGVGRKITQKIGEPFPVIRAKAREIASEREAADAREKLARRKVYAKRVKTVEDELWDRADALMAEKKTTGYDSAVRILGALKDLYLEEGRWTDFLEQVIGLKDRYPTLTGLHQRMKDGWLFREEPKPKEEWTGWGKPEPEFDEGVFEL